MFGSDLKNTYSCSDARKAAKHAVQEFAKVQVNLQLNFRCIKKSFPEYPKWDERFQVFAEALKKTGNDPITHFILPPMSSDGWLSAGGMAFFDSMSSVCFAPTTFSIHHLKMCIVHEVGHNLGATHDPYKSCTVMDTGLFACSRAQAKRLTWSAKSLKEISKWQNLQ